MSEATLDAERLRAFGAAIDAIRDRVEADLGARDLAYVERVDAVSRGLELVGRALIHFSFEPLTFGLGVAALAAHKILAAAEIGHMALHGAWDRVPGAERFRSETYRWATPIDEAAWRYGHNVRHHQYTNVAGRDPDVHFGQVRLTEHAPAHRGRPLPLWIELPIAFANFGFVMNLHFTGLLDVYLGKQRDAAPDFIADRSWKSIAGAHWKALRKYVPYYLYDYVLFPLLAGPFFWKVLLGNWLAETIRDVYLATTIYCGHVGEEVASYAPGTRAHGRGAWYAMQVESANDFAVSWPVSVLCGALDLQIEHHLFPRLPPNRLREIAPEVEAACAEHGVRYRKKSWPATLGAALAHIRALRKAETREKAEKTPKAAPLPEAA